MDGEDAASSVMEALELPEQVIELSFHPKKDIIATGLVNGRVYLHQFSEMGHEQALELTHHGDSCRSVLFSADGSALYTGSKDMSLAAVGETGQIAWRKEKAHLYPINSLYAISESVLASGDDQGVVKIWDTRTTQEVAFFDVNTDFISDMTTNEEGDRLLATSGDAMLSVFDLRRRKLEGSVDNNEDELLSVAIIKNGNRVVCGTQNGVLVTWPWGNWGDRSSRFRGHPHSVDTLLKLDEDTVLTGSSDGIIRVVSLQPDKFLGLLGDHEDFPVESIEFSRDKKWIGSVSHDSKVRFWHVEYLFEEEEEEEEEEEAGGRERAMEEGTGVGATTKGGLGMGIGMGMGMDMDSDLDSDSDSDQEGGGGGEGEGGVAAGNDGGGNGDSSEDSDMGGGGRAAGGQGMRGKIPTAAEHFFADL